MLGHGDWHRLVPKDPIENVQWRLSLLEACEHDPVLKQAIWQACRDDILFYCNAFVWYHNPNNKTKVGPFVLWPFQEEMLLATIKRWVILGKDFVWEKSREMGATWLALILVDWLCLFHEWEQCMAISHSEKAVDNGEDPNTLFWKIRHMHKHLPEWILRGVRNRQKRFAITYPATNSAVQGYASTSRSGVGGRGRVLLDELGLQQNASDIIGNTADIGPRLFISTHYGIGTAFAELCQRPDLPKHLTHWSMHPGKNKGLYRWNEQDRRVDYLSSTDYSVIPKEQSDYDWPPDYPYVMNGEPSGGPFPGLRSPWYDEECGRRRDKRQIAQHLDISPEGSDSLFFDALILRHLRLSYCRNPVWEGELEFDHFTAQPIRLVEKQDGRIKLWRHPLGGQLPLSKYALGIDISAGVGATCTVLIVADAITGEKVLEFADPYMGGDRFGPLAVSIARLFKGENIEGAFMVWEKQGGSLFTRDVVRLGYQRFYRHRNRVDESLRPTFSEKPGWNSDPKAKRVLLQEYKRALEDRKYINRSFPAIDECQNFRWNMRGEIEHSREATTDDPTRARENHGDRTMCDALTWMGCQEIGAGHPNVEEVRTIPIGGWEWRRQQAMDQIALYESEYAE